VRRGHHSRGDGDQRGRRDHGRTVPAREKIRLIEYLGELDFRLAQGASERIQLEALLAHLAAVGAGGR
jgi:DNA polymerase III delta prime subunit